MFRSCTEIREEMIKLSSQLNECARICLLGDAALVYKGLRSEAEKLEYVSRRKTGYDNLLEGLYEHALDNNLSSDWLTNSAAKEAGLNMEEFCDLPVNRYGKVYIAVPNDLMLSCAEIIFISKGLHDHDNLGRLLILNRNYKRDYLIDNCRTKEGCSISKIEINMIIEQALNSALEREFTLKCIAELIYPNSHLINDLLEEFRANFSAFRYDEYGTVEEDLLANTKYDSGAIELLNKYRSLQTSKGSKSNND